MFQPNVSVIETDTTVRTNIVTLQLYRCGNGRDSFVVAETEIKCSVRWYRTVTVQ